MVLQENWWCPPEEYTDVQDDFFIHFFNQGCQQFEGIDSDCITVYSVFGNKKFPDHQQCQDNVNFLFIGENMTVHLDHPLYFTMDAILTFFYDTPNSIRLPLWMIYWKFYEDGLFEISNNSPTERKKKAVIVISHDNNEIRRQICTKVIQKFGLLIDSNFQHVPHDSIISIPSRGTIHKRSLLSKYQYNICAENSFHPGYVTEKIFEAFFSGCIPIYWGHVPVEPDILNQECFINIFDENDNMKIPLLKNVWKENALLFIYSTYLKVWSVVYKKKQLKHLRNNQITVIYPVCSENECIELLEKHWMFYKKFWNPRPHFRLIHDTSGDILKYIFMEDLADIMYDKYRTKYE